MDPDAVPGPSSPSLLPPSFRRGLVLENLSLSAGPAGRGSWILSTRIVRCLPSEWQVGLSLGCNSGVAGRLHLWSRPLKHEGYLWGLLTFRPSCKVIEVTSAWQEDGWSILNYFCLSEVFRRCTVHTYDFGAVTPGWGGFSVIDTKLGLCL